MGVLKQRTSLGASPCKYGYIYIYICIYIYMRMGIQSEPTLISPVYTVMQATARGHKTDDPLAQDP